MSNYAVMVALLVGCGSDTAKQGKQGKHMNVGLYWFGETLDPTHEWMRGH